MNPELTMSVSPMTGSKDNRKFYVLFMDGDRSAEIRMPDNTVISRKGFTEEEISGLLQYTKQELTSLEKMASSVSPLKAFMGQTTEIKQ
ncbi:MAG: hypothetical protein K5871_03125 [Lachnospiraceae bacterium]|nr:hypothetical protein [Lachnospiraceae bacterium]